MRSIHFIAPAFFISVFTLGTLLPVSAAYAACAAPVANAGALDWFTADTKFKYCDGTNWVTIGSSGLWTLNGSDVYYTTGNVGVGWTNPVVALDINGGLRMGDSNTACNATYEGTLRYSSANKIDFCDGTAWVSIAGTPIPGCTAQEYTTPGSYGYVVVAGCEDLLIEAYGAGGGAGYYGGSGGNGGGGGGSSRVDDSTPTTLALGAGGGGGGIDTTMGSFSGGGGGGGFGQKIVTLTPGDNLTIIVGSGGQSGCFTTGGPGGSPSGGAGGNVGVGGNSTYGGGGGGDTSYSGGNSTYGGGGGGGNAGNNGSTTTYGGAGGADKDNTCGTSTNGGSCGGIGEGGGGGGGLGDIGLQGLAGDAYGGGSAANGGPGTGAAPNTTCPTAGGNGKVVIRPL